MKKTTELTSPPIVGKYYLVPCLVTDYELLGYPVVGASHSDPELGAEREHFHIDVRFVSDSDLPPVFGYFSRFNISPAQVFMTRIPDAGPVIWKKLKCKREMPDFPFPSDRQFKDFYASYEGKPVRCGKCPHRGFDLRSLPERDGIVICNGHGLAIDLKKGCVVRRNELKEKQ